MIEQEAPIEQFGVLLSKCVEIRALVGHAFGDRRKHRERDCHVKLLGMAGGPRNGHNRPRISLGSRGEIMPFQQLETGVKVRPVIEALRRHPSGLEVREGEGGGHWPSFSASRWESSAVSSRP